VRIANSLTRFVECHFVSAHNVAFVWLNTCPLSHVILVLWHPSGYRTVWAQRGELQRGENPFHSKTSASSECKMKTDEKSSLACNKCKVLNTGTKLKAIYEEKYKYFEWKIYYIRVHVSSTFVLIIRRSNFINTASGIVTFCKWPSGAQDGAQLCSKHVEDCNKLIKKRRICALSWTFGKTILRCTVSKTSKYVLSVNDCKWSSVSSVGKVTGYRMHGSSIWGGWARACALHMLPLPNVRVAYVAPSGRAGCICCPFRACGLHIRCPLSSTFAMYSESKLMGLMIT
jgi:hypothetical protein